MRLLIALAAAALAVLALQEKPCNTTCPVMEGKAVKPRITSTYQGRLVAFCCTKCKKLWDKDPSEFAGNLPPVEPAVAEIGKPDPTFELKDVDGKKIDTLHLTPLLILQWIDPACPTSKRVATEVVRKTLDRITAPKVHHAFVYSGSGTSASELKKFVEGLKLGSVTLIDSDFNVARSLGAVTSSHVLVIHDRILRYSGAIDDDPDGRKGDKAVNYVVEAVKAIEEGKPVKTEATPPYGTELKK